MCVCVHVCMQDCGIECVYVCVSVAPEPVQADSWPVVLGSDQERDNTKVRAGSQRSSVCVCVCVCVCACVRAYGRCPRMKCVVAAHVQSFPSKKLFCVCAPSNRLLKGTVPSVLKQCFPTTQ